MDGANSAFSFTGDAELRLQSRGHFLQGGPREAEFDLLKRWARFHEGRFFDVIGDRYVVYGEWLYAKHTVFYDALPHYFMEFDVLDQATDRFLGTRERRELLQGLPIVPVLVLFDGVLSDPAEVAELSTTSHFIGSQAASALRGAVQRMGLDPNVGASDRPDGNDGRALHQGRGRWRGQGAAEVRPDQLYADSYAVGESLGRTTDSSEFAHGGCGSVWECRPDAYSRMRSHETRSETV